MFQITDKAIEGEALLQAIAAQSVGALVTFEGRIRNHNDGKEVEGLEYDIYPELAIKEGELIIAEARAKFPIHDVFAVHRHGRLELGQVAVLVAVSSSHRDEAFAACRYVIDEVKQRVPIWKREFYVSGKSEWVGCPACASKTHKH